MDLERGKDKLPYERIPADGSAGLTLLPPSYGQNGCVAHLWASAAPVQRIVYRG